MGAALALACGAPPASAALSLIVTSPVTLSNFTPGQTASGNGTMTVTNGLGASWSLQAQDQGSGAGHMSALPTGCTGSDATLRNAVQVNVTSTAGGVSVTGAISLSATGQTVATAANQASAAAASLSAGYTQVIPLSEMMLTGCVYTITVTYTVQ